jgi:hypothetical protein
MMAPIDPLNAFQIPADQIKADDVEPVWFVGAQVDTSQPTSLHWFDCV